MKKIAIQGIKGCFHHVSLIKYLWVNGYEIVECKSFNQLAKSITNKEANLGIIAIENSIIGSIISNYIFLLNHHFKILGSIVQYIEQHLMTFFSRKLKFNEILSHPIALQQCDNFISEYTYLRIKKYSDTAIASLYIYKYMLKKKAAIASKLASKEYNLKIIYENIQNISKNFTKFVLIEPESLQKKIKENWNISSLFLKIKKKIKFLIFLTVLAKKKILMTKIVYFYNKYGEYLFYIDIIIDNNMDYEYIKSKTKYISYIFFIIGEYINLSL